MPAILIADSRLSSTDGRVSVTIAAAIIIVVCARFTSDRSPRAQRNLSLSLSLSINPQDREINDGESSARPIDPDPSSGGDRRFRYTSPLVFRVRRRIYHFGIRRIDSTLVPDVCYAAWTRAPRKYGAPERVKRFSDPLEARSRLDRDFSSETGSDGVRNSPQIFPSEGGRERERRRP